MGGKDNKEESLANIEKPYLIGIDGAASLLGISRATFNRWYDSGKLGPLPVRLSRRPLWVTRELFEWCYCHCPDRTKWQIIRQEKMKTER